MGDGGVGAAQAEEAEVRGPGLSEPVVPELDDLAVGARAPGQAPAGNEIRFGLVLYGGVSLAIYIYGVVFEFWRLMKASAGQEENGWSPLLEKADVTAAVDIASGTSAGGINGVLLAKAVACGSDLKDVEYIWTEKADFSGLLRGQGEAALSLLSTDVFETLLQEGLEKLSVPRPGGGPLARVFDLFVSATRIRPQRGDFRTDLGTTIHTKQYRKRFHFRLRPETEQAADGSVRPRNDFLADRNGPLADAARSTSAFPGAFEPRAVPSSDGDGEPAYMVDGGVLHNKPFTEAIDTALSRASDRPVQRWLVSVEPDPEGRGTPDSGVPLADEVVSKALLSIPRYQSIAGDLERLQAHRGYTERQAQLLKAVDATRLADPEPQAPTLHDSQRRAQLASDLVALLAGPMDLSETQQRQLEAALAVVAGDELAAENDFAYEQRRLYFLIKRLAARDQLDEAQRATQREIKRGLWGEFDRIAQQVWSAYQSPDRLLKENLGALSADGGLPAAATRIAASLPGVFADTLAEVRQRTRALCETIDQAQLLTNEQVPATRAWEEYPHWDVYLLPVDPALGFARDSINLARVSPEDAGYIRIRPSEKLAGDSLGHFGGFLDRKWRENDILWGRLDAAEQIVRMVGAGLQDEKALQTHIERVQREILEDALPKVPRENYRDTLARDHKIGAESLTDLQPRKLVTLGVDAVGVVRNLLAGLETAHGPQGTARQSKVLSKAYHYLGWVVGALLAGLRWPVATLWGKQPPLIRAGSLVVLAATVWSVVSVVLDVFTDQIDLHRGGWLAVGGSGLVFLVWTLLMAKGNQLLTRLAAAKRMRRASPIFQALGVKVQERKPPDPQAGSEPES